MIFELLYTSVPKGLKPGAKGYCTVLTTEGIPSALLERLEGYCGYRHLFSPGSPDNPEAFGHRILNLAGNTWHILSRVADAGSDYSGRSNLIGHFMAISEDELKGISAGPTSLMMSDGFFRTVLEGEPRRVSESETRKRLGNLTDKTQQALTWANVTGHAGWAGRLVQVTEETSDSIALVYPLRTKTLKLLDEAASILPKHKQWDITFNTFFTKSGEECRWRCYCADVTEAGPFKGGEFDLLEVKRIGEPPVDSPYAEAATNGKNKVGASPAAKSPSGAKARTPIKSNSEKSLEAGQSFVDKRKAKREDDDFHAIINKDTKQPSVKPTQHSLEVLPRQAGPLPPPVNRAARSIDLVNDVINDGKNSRNRKSQSREPFKTAFYFTAGLLAIVLLLIAGYFGIQIILSKPNTNVVEIPKGDAKKAEPSDDKPKDDKSKEELLVGKTPEDKAGGTAPAKTTPPVPGIAETQKTTPPVPEKVAEIPKTAPPVPGKAQKIPKTAPVVKAMVQGAKEAAENVNALIDIVAYKKIEGNLIVPLDTFLKEKSKNKEEFERIIKEGITVKLLNEIKLEGKPNVNYLNFPVLNAKTFQIDLVKDNTFNIKLPSDLTSSDIENCTFAFCKIPTKQPLTVQFFEPITVIKEVEIASIKEESLCNIKSIHFKADKTNYKIKYEKIRSLLDTEAKKTKNVYLAERICHTSIDTKNFYFINKDIDWDRIVKKLILNYKNSGISVLISPQHYEELKVQDPNSKDKKEIVKDIYEISFTNFRLFTPAVFTERINLFNKLMADKQTDRKVLKDKIDKEIEEKCKKRSDGEFELGHYIFSPQIDKGNIREMYKRLALLISEYNNCLNNTRFGSEFLLYLGVKADISKLAEESNKRIKQYVDQMKDLQKSIQVENLEFLVSYTTKWNIEIDQSTENINKEFYKDAQIIVYTYKQPK